MEDPDHPALPSQATDRTIRSDEAFQPSLNITFISIHDLSPEARILYSSESILDVLGYTPDEVVNRSVWDFFSEDEIHLARSIHRNGIETDKAAMLVYCKVRDSNGDWIGCECCFTVVYDVMVVCTSVYKSGVPSQKRAMEAPLVRRIFASSPKDPRYHMLSHLSYKFRTPRKPSTAHEPRAALFLNRFTRTLTVMYATSGIQEILGISSAELQGKSFYYCIAENCLSDAVRCLENAKGNDSIAYLRFWFRNPLQADSPDSSDDTVTDDSDVDMTTTDDTDSHARDSSSGQASSTGPATRSGDDTDDGALRSASSADSTAPTETHRAIFGTEQSHESSASSASRSPSGPQNASNATGQVELEAVVSCASDGLVVCLRRARPRVPEPLQRPSPTQPQYDNGFFAAPWADEPIVSRTPAHDRSLSNASSSSPLEAGGPHHNDFMAAIRDQAVFAWALTGINGTLHKYAAGSPRGESTPPSGMPIWLDDNATDANTPSASDAKSTGSLAHDNTGFSPVDSQMPVGNDHRTIFGDPGLKHSRGPSDASQPQSGSASSRDHKG